MLNELQQELWEKLCELSGEEVARLFTDYYGNQLLDEDFKQFMIDEEYLEEE